jgi:hypothetical protein
MEDYTRHVFDDRAFDKGVPATEHHVGVDNPTIEYQIGRKLTIHCSDARDAAAKA